MKGQVKGQVKGQGVAHWMHEQIAKQFSSLLMLTWVDKAACCASDYRLALVICSDLAKLMIEKLFSQPN